MIMTETEFITCCKEIGVSRLQLAYLIETRLLATPLQIERQSGLRTLLFDDMHHEELRVLMAGDLASGPHRLGRHHGKSLSPALLTQARGLSPETVKLVNAQRFGTKHKPDTILPIDLRDLVASQPGLPSEDLQPSRIRRLRQWIARKLGRLNPFRVDLTGAEFTGYFVKLIMLPNRVTAYYFERVYLLDDTPFDRCLSEYVYSAVLLGWDNLQSEIELVQRFTKQVPDLSRWPIRRALDFLATIEAKYDEVSTFVRQYCQQLDPNRQLSEYIAAQHLSPLFKRIIERDDKRRQANAERWSEIGKKVTATVEEAAKTQVKDVLTKL